MDFLLSCLIGVFNACPTVILVIHSDMMTFISSDTADVFFIDFGNTELVTLDQICVEFPPIVRSVPPMAVRCCMAGIKPVSINPFGDQNP